jgi:hypothetical protein
MFAQTRSSRGYGGEDRAGSSPSNQVWRRRRSPQLALIARSLRCGDYVRS